MFKNYSILIVEDDKEISEYMCQLLEEDTKEIFVAFNGEEGLKFYNEYKPDIIISDLNMPVMNGIEMCKEIKKINMYQPIILVTGHSDVEHLKEAINLGINSFVEKPITSIDLLYLKIEEQVKRLSDTQELSIISKSKKEKKMIVNNMISSIMYEDDESINYSSLDN